MLITKNKSKCPVHNCIKKGPIDKNEIVDRSMNIQYLFKFNALCYAPNNPYPTGTIRPGRFLPRFY